MTTLKVRGGTAAQWQAANPVLAEREVGVETDTGLDKLGDGTTPWTQLPYRADAAFARGRSAFPTTTDGDPGRIGPQSVNGNIELVASAGLADGEFATAVLGVLHDRLYLIGSQMESAKDLAGVFRVDPTGLTRLGEAAGSPDFNRFLSYGAVEYQGSLYVGDRRSGNLYRLVLDADGGFVSLDSVATAPSGEDIFPGPVVWGSLWCGGYGRDAGGSSPPPSNARLMTFDGTAFATVIEFADLGPGGEVLSVVVHAGEVWCTVASKDRTVAELWVVGPDRHPRRLHRGATPYLLASWQGDLVASVRSFDRSTSPHPQLHVYRDGAFLPISQPFGDAGVLQGLHPVGDSLLAFHYYAGIYRYRGDSVTRISAAPPRVVSTAVHDGYLYMVSNQPVALYRMPIGTDHVVKALGSAQQQHGSRVDRWEPGLSTGHFVRPGMYTSPPAATLVETVVPYGFGYAVPVWLPAGRYDEIAVEVTGAAETTHRLAVFDDDGSGYPHTPLAQATVSTGAIGFAKADVDVTLSAGLYWLVDASQTPGPQARLRYGRGGPMPVGFDALGTVAQRGTPYCYRDDTGGSAGGTFRRWPSVVRVDLGAPRIYLRRAAAG